MLIKSHFWRHTRTGTNYRKRNIFPTSTRCRFFIVPHLGPLQVAQLPVSHRVLEPSKELSHRRKRRERLEGISPVKNDGVHPLDLLPFRSKIVARSP